ncbi:MAG: hypothetical protein IGR92_16335 [Leptolyngbyaceae cyanobacterium T60_A2020_046]|nr:hypothetical protein [Leptolyngbyaceae cyanobacterium T60_A2020_046]
MGAGGRSRVHLGNQSAIARKVTIMQRWFKIALSRNVMMPDDVMSFLIGVGLFIAYLVWSAATEMGTRWPWRR